jgi:hypothetical protein
LRAFLEEGGFGAFTDTFEDLHGMGQLPGIATQRLMASGFRLRLRRRGRLEDRRPRTHHESHGAGLARWHLVYGGLYLRLRRHP